MKTTCNAFLCYVTILNKPIPIDGRHITRREVKLLQAQDVRCSTRWKVCREGESPTVGVLFMPNKGEFVNTTIEVRVKAEKYSI